MLIWKNTTILNSRDEGLTFTDDKNKAIIALMGSQSIDIEEFPYLKAIFRAGIGRDNVPEKKAIEKGIVVRYPSDKTINIVYEETASFTCGLIFQMLYGNVGTIVPWGKKPRPQLSQQTLLVIGTGRIGGRVAKLMKPFMNVTTFDILQNDFSELKQLMQQADCLTIHIPKNNENISFIDDEKLSWIKDNSVLINTARGEIVDEEALYKELQTGRLKAAFDVFWQEPYDGKLKEFYPEQFSMTPHVASTSNEFIQGCRNDLNILLNDIQNL